MTWLGMQFSDDYWREHWDELRDERRAQQAIYGEHTRSGTVTPACQKNYCFRYVDINEGEK